MEFLWLALLVACAACVMRDDERQTVFGNQCRVC